jgi:LruC domain-containing protein
MIVGTSVNGAPGLRSKEIHLANYKPSDLFDTSYFGKSSDRSSPTNGRYFVTANNLPFAIDVAETFDWVVEYQSIINAHKVFWDWADSGGSRYADWYTNNPEYRANHLLYPTNVRN